MKKLIAVLSITILIVLCVSSCALSINVDVGGDKPNVTYSFDDETSTNENNASTSNADETNVVTSFEKNDVNIYFMYVGQADSILIDCNGHYALVDCGNVADGPKVVEYLNNLGVKELEYLIISHPHEDHMGGASYVVKNIPIKKAIMPERMVTTKVFENMIDALLEKDVETIAPEPKESYSLGDGSFYILSCDDDADNLNDTSVVTIFSYGDNDILFTGDASTKIESEILDWYKFSDIEVLKVGHHGSRTSTGSKFLEAVNPEIAIISCGINNDYGHPTDEALSRINKKNITLYRTDELGSVILTCDKNNYNVFVEGSRVDGDSDDYNFVNHNSSIGCSKEEASYVVSTSGTKYHKLDCSYAKNMKEENAVYFKTEDEALNAGYEKCSHCCK